MVIIEPKGKCVLILSENHTYAEIQAGNSCAEQCSDKWAWSLQKLFNIEWHATESWVIYNQIRFIYQNIFLPVLVMALCKIFLRQWNHNTLSQHQQDNQDLGQSNNNLKIPSKYWNHPQISLILFCQCREQRKIRFRGFDDEVVYNSPFTSKVAGSI